MGWLVLSIACLSCVHALSRGSLDISSRNVALPKWWLGPAHLYTRESAITFWAGDFSAGAGSISSPVRAEHLKNASEIVLIGEDLGSRLAGTMPRWLLLSILGVVTRELTSRDVREKLVPQLYESSQAQEKARGVSALLRRNLDQRVTRVLETYTRGGGKLSGAISRLVEEEVAEVQRSLTSYDDVIENEIVAALQEVLELELSERFELGVSAAVQLNVSDSVDEISSLLRVADKNADGELSFDEVYDLVAGEPINPVFNELAQRWIVLKSPELTQNRWERWSSLVLAPWIGRLSRAAQLFRATMDYAERYGETQLKATARRIVRDYAPESVRFPDAFERLLGSPPPAELMETLPGLSQQEVLLPARDLEEKTAALVADGVEGTTEFAAVATETLIEGIAIVSSRKAELNEVLAAKAQQRLLKVQRPAGSGSDPRSPGAVAERVPWWRRPFGRRRLRGDRWDG